VSVEHDKCSARPSISKVTEKILELIREDCLRGNHELADTVGISYEACQILTENLDRLSALRTGCALPIERSSGTDFCYRLSKPQGHGAIVRIR
jgi:DNA-binding Lrp family transcriptional regulator